MATKKVVWRGGMSRRVLNSDDLQKAGVEAGVFKHTEFPRFEPVEVEDVVADALIENPGLFGKFGIHEDAAEETQSASGDEAGMVTETGANQESTGTPSTGAAKATGSSTRTR